MFIYFKPKVRKEIANVKLYISISFDGWGSKREKLSVVVVVIYFINAKYKYITRLIGLLELLDHGKAGVDI
jgi:hypothetical protein